MNLSRDTQISSQTSLESNATSVITEIDEIQRRLMNAVKERTEHLKSDVDKYLVAERTKLKVCTQFLHGISVHLHPLLLMFKLS